MKKKIFLLIIVIIYVFPIFLLTGCSSGHVSMFITSKPKKVAYEVGEQFSKDGLNVEYLNSDGTTTKMFINDEHILGADTSTSGEKIVTVKKDNLSTIFNIYVADVVISPQDNVKEKFEAASEGDVVYLTKGEYKNIDNSLTDIIIDKQLFIVGAGKNQTIFEGNFIVGATKNNDKLTPVENFEGVKFNSISFKREFKVDDGKIKYNNDMKLDKYGAIYAAETKNLYVSDCSFKGYSYGILTEKADGLCVVRCAFNNIFLSAIKSNIHSNNVSIFKNTFYDIGESVLYVKDGEQDCVNAISLGFNKKENVGVIISNNTFVRIGQKTKDWIYYNENSENFVNNNENLSQLGYVKNSSIILLHSNNESNLQSSGIILSANNYGATLQNIKLGKTSEDLINQSGIIINENF